VIDAAPQRARGLEPAGRAALAWARRAWERHPLAVILAAAAAIRLVAAVWSKGYGMYDDHFFTVEVAQRWLEGHRDWLGDPTSFHSLLYPGFHLVLFAGLQRLGLTDPQAKMLVVRLLHAAWSLGTVWFGYQLALALAGGRARSARTVGLLLALLAYLPFPGFAVRNLVEVVCQPPLLAAFWMLSREGPPGRARPAFAAGLFFGLAFALRFQTAVLGGTAGLVLLAERRWRAALALAAGFALSCLAFQALPDWIGYGRPFSSVLAYFAFNSNPTNIAAYPIGPWYQYLGLLAGLLLPPASLLLLFGFVRTWRRHALVFWPTVAFLAVHSAYPNKQERFLLPIVPLVVVLAVVGWDEFARGSRFWTGHRRLSRWVWGVAWALNLVALPVLSTTYSKKTRVETLTWLRARPDLAGVVIESSEGSVQSPPLFYLGRPVAVYTLPASKSVDALGAELAAAPGPRPNYVVLMGQKGIEERRARLAALFPGMVLEARVVPSLVDQVAHRLNPKHNVNLTADVYRVPEPAASP
jgi:hypothetical protein